MRPSLYAALRVLPVPPSVCLSVRLSRTGSELFFPLMWLNGLVVSALGIRTRGPGFASRVVPLFHWVATLGKLFTHIASSVSQLQETGLQKGSFRRLSGYGN